MAAPDYFLVLMVFAAACLGLVLRGRPLRELFSPRAVRR